LNRKFSVISAKFIPEVRRRDADGCGRDARAPRAEEFCKHLNSLFSTWTAILVVNALLVGCGQKADVPKADAPKVVASEAVDDQLVKTACGMTMVKISGGDFMMGNADGPIDVKPAHDVKVDGFLMDQTLVPQEVYEKLMGTNPSRRRNPRNPVEQTTWLAAIKFCNARSTQEGLTPCYDLKTGDCNFSANGYRLPTEAEWEYAARAGTKTKYFFGDSDDQLKLYGWFQDNSESKTHPVGQKKPNPWKLYDIAGNLWEWCNDYYGTKYYRTSPADNPRGAESGEKRVLRGGAWSSSSENCTSFARNCDESGATDVCLTMDSYGFRCVRRL
jgi:formylglycine-generating enzyme required for sulfatase activity